MFAPAKEISALCSKGYILSLPTYKRTLDQPWDTWWKRKKTNIQILAHLVAIDPCTIGTLVPESKLNLTLCKRRHYEEDNNEDAKNAVSSRRRPEKNPSLVLDNLTLALRNCSPPLLRAHIRLPRRRENINSICGIQGLHCTYLTLPDHIITWLCPAKSKCISAQWQPRNKVWKTHYVYFENLGNVPQWG